MKKHVVGRTVFYVVLLLFVGYYVIGGHGVYYWYSLKSANCELARDIAQQKRDIAQLMNEIDAWQRYDFFKEQFAREQLQLAYIDDVVYLVS